MPIPSVHGPLCKMIPIKNLASSLEEINAFIDTITDITNNTNNTNSSNINKLPSVHQIGDKVKVQFTETSEPIDGIVEAVKFYRAKVYYDISVAYNTTDNDSGYDYIIPHVDSWFVNK